jgi:hypothetical protein
MKKTGILMGNSTVSRVEKEFIFNFLIKNKVKVEIKTEKNSTEGIFLDQNSKEIKIELNEIFEEMNRYEPEIKLFFYFQSSYHTFNSIILKRQAKTIIIRNPDSVARNLLRKYERVLIDGKMSVDFELEGKIQPLDFPIGKSYYFADKPPISADFSEVKINTLLAKFKEKMSNVVSSNRIIMLRNYTAKTFFEEIVLHYGKTLYLPDTHTTIPSKQFSDQYETLERNDWIDFEMSHNHTNPGMINRVLSDYLKVLAKNNIFSYSIMPILYRNYIVGLIFLLNNHQKSTPIDLRVMAYTAQFAKIVSYTLSQSGYFNAEKGVKDKFSIPIYDLSPGGIAFYMDDESMEEKLQIDTNFNFDLTIKGRNIRILTKLVRKFRKLSRYYYGFMFLGIKSDDFEFLNGYLYGK